MGLLMAQLFPLIDVSIVIFWLALFTCQRNEIILNIVLCLMVYPLPPLFFN